MRGFWHRAIGVARLPAMAVIAPPVVVVAAMMVKVAVMGMGPVGGVRVGRGGRWEGDSRCSDQEGKAGDED